MNRKTRTRRARGGISETEFVVCYVQPNIQASSGAISRFFSLKEVDNCKFSGLTAHSGESNKNEQKQTTKKKTLKRDFKRWNKETKTKLVNRQ